MIALDSPGGVEGAIVSRGEFGEPKPPGEMDIPEFGKSSDLTEPWFDANKEEHLRASFIPLFASASDLSLTSLWIRICVANTVEVRIVRIGDVDDTIDGGDDKVLPVVMAVGKSDENGFAGVGTKKDS